MLTILKHMKARYIDTHLTQEAQGMVEYALIIAFVVGIGVFLLSGDSGIGGAIRNVFNTTGNTLNSANTSANAAGGQ